MSKKIFLIGSGGHAKVLIDILSNQGIKIDAVVSPELDLSNKIFKNIMHLTDDKVFNYSSDEIILLNGIGSIPGNPLRNLMFKKFRDHSYEFLTIKAKTSIVSNSCNLGRGVQIMPGAIINADVTIGENTIINSGVIIEHDCIIGNNNHIAPGAVICGQTRTEKNVHIGTGASVIQTVTIGENSVVGAGSSITKDVEKNTKCIPAAVTKSLLDK